ncbi:MAG: MATE family efflux transporter [Lachnospiraceae bacterium]|nr:MATE family efflux transporter [Lachnospiraceae bacterium]
MNKLLLTMSVPLMVSLLVQSLYNIVDSIFVSRLSEEALTATSLVYSVQFLMIAAGVGTAVGLNALLSRWIGQQEEDRACKAATTGLFLVLGTAFIFSVIGLLFAGKLSRMLTSDPELQVLCRQYMRICMVFCYGTFLETYGQRLLQAVGYTVHSMISLVCGALTNIILDPIMIFGLFGFPALGIQGAAIATVIGQFVGAAVALGINRKMNPIIHVSLRDYHWNWQDVKDIYTVGLPTIIMQAIGSIMCFSVNAILISVSSTAVAFFGVYYKLQNFLMMPMNGLGQAAIPIVAFNYGAGNGKRIRETWRILIPVGLIFSVAGMVIFLLFPRQLLLLFSASDEMLSIGIPALRIIALTFPFATQTILYGYVGSGLGNGLINMIGGALRQLVLLVPFVWIFTRFLGLQYTWYAMWISEIAAFLVSFFAIRSEMKEKVDPITHS